MFLEVHVYVLLKLRLALTTCDRLYTIFTSLVRATAQRLACFHVEDLAEIYEYSSR